MTTDNDWWAADVAIDRLRAALARVCGVQPNAITWSYGGVSGQPCRVQVSVRLSVPQTDALARRIADIGRPSS